MHYQYSTSYPPSWESLRVLAEQDQLCGKINFTCARILKPAQRVIHYRSSLWSWI